MLTMAGVGRLDSEGIQAILNLVAAAVPGLRPQNIAIVDSRGDLLARAGEPVGPAATALSTEEVRRATELQLSHAVEEMLERSLGAGHVRAEAAVRMSFDRLNQTEERYDPDGQVTRSSQNVTSNSKSSEPNGTVAVQNNLPNADAGREAAGTQEARQEETTNYEISKTVRTLIREQPQIDRISLAVMVDGTDSVGADGKHTWQPRAAEELDRITGLVKSAIGFDEKRGDHVEVVSMRFTNEDSSPVADSGGLLGIEPGQGRPAASGADRAVRRDRGARAAARAATDGAAHHRGCASGAGRRWHGTGLARRTSRCGIAGIAGAGGRRRRRRQQAPPARCRCSRTRAW